MNSPNELSFLPDDYLENKAQRRANVICAILFLVTMVSIGFAFTTSERSLRAVEQDHAKIEKDFTEAARRIEQVQEMQEKQRTMAHQAELTASLLEKVPRSLILAKITNALPTGVSLTDFVLTSNKRASAAAAGPKTAFETKSQQGSLVNHVAQAKTYDVALKITGLAPTDVQVGELLRKLKAVPLFKDVNLIISDWEQANAKKTSTDTQYRKFQIEMMLDPSADAQSEAAAATASLQTSK